MKNPTSSVRRIAVAATACVLLASCTRGDADLASPEQTGGAPTSTPTPSTPVPGPQDPDAESDEGAEPSESSGDNPTSTSTSASASTVDTPTISVAPPISVADIAEVGVPGLDSDDKFCAAWSRFAGSFQVVAVTAAFGSGTSEQLASLEVAAAPTVEAAYEELVSNWPDELSSEADIVADRFLGPFARRLGAAVDALRDTGADDATIAAISDAWLAGLAQRDPTTPEFVVDLPDEVWAMIDVAAADFSSLRVPFSTDPSLVTNVETPLTSEYLAVECPDQGTLSGQEVETP